MFTWNRQKAAFCSLSPRSRQRQASLVALAGILCAAGVGLGAAVSQAVVRQKVNVVTLAPNLTGEARPAAQGAVIHEENVVRTGTESRAALEFTDPQLGAVRCHTD